MKNVLVTGVSSGIGQALVERFARRGCRVWGIDRVAPGSDAQLTGFLRFDLANLDELPSAVASLLGGETSLDVLVNNAAHQDCAPLEEAQLESIRRQLDVNLLAPLVLTQACLNYLTQAKGAVVNVASVHALATSQGIGAYAASKGGLLAWTRAAALELASRGIRVNAVLPGAVDTPMLRDGLRRGQVEGSSPDGLLRFAAKHPLGRVGRPDDIAAAVEFLADGERAGFVTGASLVVDGGVLARLSTEADL